LKVTAWSKTPTVPEDVHPVRSPVSKPPFVTRFA